LLYFYKLDTFVHLNNNLKLQKVDIFDKFSKGGPLGQFSDVAHGYYLFPKLEGEIGPHMNFNGKPVLNWSLNNYLGMANHPEVRKADADAARDWGLAAPMGARMMSGQTKYHELFENQLAEFVQKEAAYLLNFGYPGMVSIIDALVSRNDVIVYDSDCHACIMDALRMVLAKRFVFPHNNMDKLKVQLEHAKKWAEKTGGGVLVITEGVFGMADDLGKLDKIVEFKKEYSFRLLVDDAHGFGTMGPNGRGTGEHFGVQDGIDVYFSTFAKAMASVGGFVAADKKVIRYLMYNMRSQIYAKSLPMPLVIGGMKRLELLKTDKSLRENLWTIVHAIQNGLKANGFNVGNCESPVTPVYLSGTIGEATHIVYDLRENYGIFCSIVTYPVVPKGILLLRVIPTAAHTLEDVNRTIDVFKKVRDKLENGEYSKELNVQLL